MITIAAHPISPRRAGAHRGVSPPPPWSEAELAYLKAERAKIPPTPIPVIAKALGRQTPATYNRARLLGAIVQKHRAYTDEDRARLKELAAIYPPLTDGAIAAELGHGPESIRWLMQKMDLMEVRKALHARHAAERKAERDLRIAAERALRPPRAPRIRKAHAVRIETGPDASLRLAAQAAAREQRAEARALIMAEAVARAEISRALRVLALEELAHHEMLAKARAAHARAEQVRLAREATAARKAEAAAARSAKTDAHKAAVAEARRVQADAREAARREKAVAVEAQRREKIVERARLANEAARLRAQRVAAPKLVVQLTPVATSVPKPAPPERSFATMPGPGKLATRDQALALSNAAADAVAAFIAAKGVTRIAADPREAAIARLRQLGYEVLAHGKGVILDRKTVLRNDAAILAYLAERDRSHAA